MLIVGECDQFHAGVLKGFLGHGEAIGVGSHHTDYLAGVLADGLHGLQAAATGGDEIFHDDDLHARPEFSLDEVLQSMVLGFVADIDEGEIEDVCHEGSLWNGSCSHASHCLCLREMLQDGMGKFQLHVVAEFGIGESLAVVAIEG